MKFLQQLSKEFLITEYIYNKKSSMTIGNESGHNHKTILRYLKYHNIKIRDCTERQLGDMNHMYGKHWSEKSKDKIRKVLLNREMSVKTKQKMCDNHANFKGDRHPRWNGGRRLRTDGYIEIYSSNHPFRNKNNNMLEHRVIMEKHLGRYLTSEEEIHHRGIRYPISNIRNRSDNRIENLQLFKTKSEHQIFHHKLPEKDQVK